MRTEALVSICAPEVLAIPVIECGEALADVRTLPGVQMTQRYAEDPSCFFLVRQGVLLRLQAAQRLLPPGCRLLFAEGLRPLSAQRRLQQRVAGEIARAHPAWTAEQVRAETSLYVAPPDDTPPHSTGAAVDLTLADEHGAELPMGSPLNNADVASHTAMRPEAPDAQRHRALLCTVMREAGFVNYDAEWWHWSYGDRYWALRYGRPAAIYASVEGDEALRAQMLALAATQPDSRAPMRPKP